MSSSSSSMLPAAMTPWIYLSIPAAILAAMPAIYGLVSSTVLPDQSAALRNKNVCLLIAHPDDEAMFFAPTVQALTKPGAGNQVKILCLSSGNSEGLGETRKKELAKSAVLLGLREEEDVHVIESEDFQDSMTATWDKSKISNLLLQGFAPYRHQRPKIDALITFDRYGVSSHPNHISLYHGAREFLEQLAGESNASSSSLRSTSVELYTLTTVGIARKYAGILDIFVTLLTAAGSLTPKEPSQFPDGLVFASRLTGENGIRRARAAMIQAHKSQMVWFRYGWIYLSRYMVINQLKREVVVTSSGERDTTADDRSSSPELIERED